MKKEKRILNVLGQVDEKYIEEAAPGKRTVKKHSWIKWISAAACFAALAAAALPFVQTENETGPVTPTGDNFPPAATQTEESVTPPKERNANGLHLIRLSCATPAGPEIFTDFIIHINPKLYVSREENGTYVIRPTAPMNEELPECSLQIYRVADIPPADAAELIRENLTASYLHVSDIGDSEVTDGLFLHADNGSEWDAKQADLTITDDLLGGSYVLAARYFTEAAEGHGIRFADMTGTFKAVTNADSSAMPAYLFELYRTISEFVPAFFTDDTSELGDILAQDAQIYTYDADVTEDVGIASIDYSISGDETPTGSIVSIKHRISTEDSYNYLTIELTYTVDSGWTVHFAGIEK